MKKSQNGHLGKSKFVHRENCKKIGRASAKKSVLFCGDFCNFRLILTNYTRNLVNYAQTIYNAKKNIYNISVVDEVGGGGIILVVNAKLRHFTTNFEGEKRAIL